MHPEKGFVPLILVIVVVVAVFSSGVLYYRSQKPNSQPHIQEFSGPEIESKEKTKVTFKETTTDILEKELVPAPKAESKSVVSPATSNEPSKEESYVSKTEQSGDPWKDAIPQAPINLALPLAVADIEEAQTVLSPYGIIRKSGDGGIGHGGIDFPLRKGSPLYAVASGTIIKNNLEDPGGGKTVDILIMPGKFQGEGWIFKYDHVNLTPGLKVGDNVEKGQQIGTSAFVERGNNHIGLEYQSKNFTIAREKICWVDRLEVTADRELEDAFDRVKKTSAFLQFWQTANEEGHYQYRGLLDETKYPNGPQLCYTLGTDARIPIQ